MRRKARTASRPQSETDFARSLRELVDGRHGFDVVSFDCFDTLLFRRTAKFADVFYLVGVELIARGLLPRQLDPASFREIRWRAEHVLSTGARGKPHQSLKLADIYDLIFSHLPGEVAVDDCVRTELEVDSGLLVPNEYLIPAVRAIRRTGTRVIVTSNTPYSGDQLRTLFHAIGWPEDCMPDCFYASSDRGCSKQNGLFDAVLAEERLSAKQMIHIGDNVSTDCEAARRHGIEAVLASRGSLWGAEFELAHTQEAEWLDILSSEQRTLVPMGEVDALRHAALCVLEDSSPHARYGAFFVGPVLTAFLSWCAATRSPEQRLVLVEREGRVLYAVGHTLGVLEERDVILPASRYSLVRAVADVLSEDDVVVLAKRMGSRATWSAFFTAMNTDLASVAELARVSLSDLPMLESNVRTMHRLLRSSPELWSEICARSLERRERLAEALGGPDADVLIVDLGYKATIQSYVQMARDALGHRGKTSGRYLSTFPDAFFATPNGLQVLGYLTAFGAQPSLWKLVQQRVALLEQCLMPPLGTVLDLGPDGVQRAPHLIPDRQVAEQLSVQRGACAYASARRDATWCSLSGQAERMASEAVLRRMLRPSAIERGLFGHWRHEVNMGGQEVVRIGLKASSGDGADGSLLDRFETGVRSSVRGRKLMKAARDPARFWRDSWLRGLLSGGIR